MKMNERSSATALPLDQLCEFFDDQCAQSARKVSSPGSDDRLISRRRAARMQIGTPSRSLTWGYFGTGASVSAMGRCPRELPTTASPLGSLVVGDAGPVDEVLRLQVLTDRAAPDESRADGHRAGARLVSSPSCRSSSRR